MTAPATSPGRIEQTSLRTRVALLVAVAVGLAVALASVAAFFTVRHELRAHLDRDLQQRASQAVGSGLPQLLSQSPSIPQAVLALGSGVGLAVVDSNGNATYVEHVPKPPLGASEVAVANGVADRSLRTAYRGGVAYRVVAIEVHPGLAFVLAESMSDINQELARMAFVLLIVGVAGIVVAAVVGLAIARAGLRPVERLTAATEHVARTEDLRPIPVLGTDELARLTASFNAMLGALALSRERQRQLVADAGHELRTPLTSLRTNLDLLAQAARDDGPSLDPKERDELLSDVRAQMDELGALVGDLVELARTDAPPATARPCDLAEVVEHSVERVRRRAPAVTFDVDAEPWPVIGDAAALERAVTNLLDNAAKWSPPGATVTVGLRDGIVEVTDQGPGIAAEDLPHVFERFYRAADARGQPGSGLGLAIVRQAAERHGGRVGVDSAPGHGARFRMWIPGRAHEGD